MTGQRELPPSEANVGHEDDDRHAIKSHHTTQDFLRRRPTPKMIIGDQWNASVISPEESST